MTSSGPGYSAVGNHLSIAYNIAYRILGDSEAAERASMYALARSHHAGGCQHEDSAEDVMRRVVRASLRELRKPGNWVRACGPGSRDNGSGDAGGSPNTSGPDDASQELNVAIQRALAGLPHKARAAIVLVDLVHCDYATAARVLRVPPHELARSLRTGRTLLATSLLRDPKEPSDPSMIVRAGSMPHGPRQTGLGGRRRRGALAAHGPA